MPRLIINSGTAQASEFELKPGANYVGRAFANDFKIEDPSVSGSHAEIIVTENSVTIKDLNSTNGTFVNRSQIKESALHSGQLLRLGNVEIAFESEFVATATATPKRVQLGNQGPTGTTILTKEPPAIAHAPPTAPVVTGMLELPDGKSACKFHPKNPAQWLCKKCRQAYCSQCVNTRRTSESTGYYCRTCGEQCVPVKVKPITRKGPEKFSDVVILLRAVGFGFAAAVLSGVIWGGVAATMHLLFFFMPPIFIWGTGALCGYAIKLAVQDRPGIVFSLLAVGFMFIGLFFGLMGVAFAHWRLMGGIVMLALNCVGLVAGVFTAWKFGGGDY